MAAKFELQLAIARNPVSAGYAWVNEIERALTRARPPR
jgi:hypothetical protein